MVSLDHLAAMKADVQRECTRTRVNRTDRLSLFNLQYL